MFPSGYFSPEYFNEYFEAIIVVVIPVAGGGGGGVRNWYKRNEISLPNEDEEIIDFIVAFVLSR